MKLLITGDRSAFPPAVLPVLAIETIKRLNAQLVLHQNGLAVGTTLELFVGDFPGVEQALRVLLETCGVSFTKLPETPLNEKGKPDLAARALYLASLELDEILVIHGDAHTSSLYKSLIAVPALADKVQLLMPAAVLLVTPDGE